MNTRHFASLALAWTVFFATVPAGFGESYQQPVPWSWGRGEDKATPAPAPVQTPAQAPVPARTQAPVQTREAETFSRWSPSLSGGLSGQTGMKTKEGWVMLDGYFTPYKHMTGGGAALSLEWIDTEWRIGLGGRVGFSMMKGDDGDFDIKSDILDLDIHIPVRLADWLIAYGGVGVELFDMEYSYVVPGTFRYQSNGSYYTKNGKKVTFVNDKPSTLTTFYAGLRFLVTECFFLYGEYHRDSGSICMGNDSSYSSREGRDMDVDMDASRYVLGGGFRF